MRESKAIISALQRKKRSGRARSTSSSHPRKPAAIRYTTRTRRPIAAIRNSRRLRKAGMTRYSRRARRSAAALHAKQLRQSSLAPDFHTLRNVYDEGRRAAEGCGCGEAPVDLKRLQLLLNESWTRCCKYNPGMRLTENLLRQGQSFAEGFTDALRVPRQRWLPVPLLKTASAVVLSCGGANAANALQQLARLPLQEIIIVTDSRDTGNLATARDYPGITVAQLAQEIGSDGGRSIGARLNGSDIILFVDGGGAARGAEGLAHYLAAVDGGADIALSDKSAWLGSFRAWDNLSRVQAFMNWSLGRPDLRANSVAALPHAWSREGLKAIGTSVLAVPALAQQAAIEQKLRFVECPCERNAQLETAGANANVIGDHFEALQDAMRKQGSRLALPDRVRRRNMAGGGRL